MMGGGSLVSKHNNNLPHIFIDMLMNDPLSHQTPMECLCADQTSADYFKPSPRRLSLALCLDHLKSLTLKLITEKRVNCNLQEVKCRPSCPAATQTSAGCAERCAAFVWRLSTQQRGAFQKAFNASFCISCCWTFYFN